jgi:iron complex outermembrane receptor protein
VKHNHNRNFGAFTLAPSPAAAIEKPFEVEQNAITKLKDNTFNGSLNVSYAGKKFNFTGLTTYQTNHRYYRDPIDGDFSPLDIITIVNNYGKDWNIQKVWTQELKFTSPASSRSIFKWTAGTYLFNQKNPGRQTTRFGANGDLYGAQPNSSVINTTIAESRGIAFYGQGVISIGKYFDITLGARFDHERKEQNVRGQYQADPDPNPMFDTQPDTTATVSYNAFSPKLGLTYHINDNHHLYAVASRGFRTGGLTQLSSDPSTPPLFQFKPEYSTNFELGIKNSLLHNRLRINASAFYIKVSDAQVPALVLPQALTITKNAGELTSQGVELEISATPYKAFQIDYNLGYTDAQYNKLLLPNGGTEVNLEGNRQLFTPEVTSMLAIQYNPQVAEWQSLQFVIRAEYIALGEQYFDLANTIRQGSYNLYNVRTGVAGDNFEVMFWLRNLTDTKYISYAYDFGGTHLGDPRNYGVTLRYMF